MAAAEEVSREVGYRIIPTNRQVVVTRILLVDEDASKMFTAKTLQLVESAQLVRSDRRKDHARRKRVSAMSTDELRQELLTDHLTGLPNARALEERPTKSRALAIIDVDGLKWFNDKLGHEAGDQLLRTVAQTLMWADLEAYRVHGDEFYLALEERGASATRALNEVLLRLSQTAFGVRDNRGHARIFMGACFSYGIGASTAAATTQLQWHKEQREKLGLRTGQRGGLPPSIQELNSELRPLAKPWVNFTIVN